MISAPARTESSLNELGSRDETSGELVDFWILPDGDALAAQDERETSTERAASDDQTSRVALDAFQQPVDRNDLVIPVSEDRVKLLQQWECLVSRVDGDCVECEMHDLTDESMPVEIAEVYVSEFSEFDRPLLVEGAVFYWSVGQVTKRKGSVQRYSELRVRRVPRLTKSQKKAILRKADELYESISGRKQHPAE